MKKSYFVHYFPVNKITHLNEEGWVHNPNHIRNRYKFLEAIIEDIKSSICEPVLLNYDATSNTWFSSGHGCNRLFAIKKLTDWAYIPAIVNVDTLPEYIKQSTYEEIRTAKDVQKYYKRQLDQVEINDNGVNIHSWKSFQPAEIMKTFCASKETKERILELFAIEHIEHRTLKEELYTEDQVSNWKQVYEDWQNGQIKIF